MLRKLWNSEPVVLIAILLVVVMMVQKLWLGEVIDQTWAEWVIKFLGVATGATVLRSAVTPAKKTHRISDHGGDDNDDYL